MIGKSSVKKPFSLARFGLCLLGFSFLSACYTLGTEKLPEQAQKWSLNACTGQALAGDAQEIHWKLSYIGPSPALPTAKQPWGSVTRFVYPYTEYTDLCELEIKNDSEDPLWVNTEAIALQQDQSQTLPLELAFFKRAWPVGAVNDQQQLIDRSLAIAEVTRNLFYSHGVLPGETYTGTLAFPRQQLPATMLRLKQWKFGESEFSQDLCLSFQPVSGT